MKTRIFLPIVAVLFAAFAQPSGVFAQTTFPKNTNQSRKLRSIISGGSGNLILSNTENAVVAGGGGNTVGANFATVGGGSGNTASGFRSTVPGGSRCLATNNGAFVWSGNFNVDTVSTNENSFTVRAPGGVRFISTTDSVLTNTNHGVILLPNTTAWTALSDRESKTDFQSIKPREVLANLAAMPVTSWKYKHDPSRRYIGPTAQDFMNAFHLGDNDKGINTLDADGVTFAAIQGLVEELKERDKAMAERDAKIEKLEHELEAIREQLFKFPPAP